MARSNLFSTASYQEIEQRISALLNSQPDYLSARSAGSPRAVGDAVQEILAEQFQTILGDTCLEYSSAFARRAMADLAFTDQDGCYYIVDVKTHRHGAAFSMPNLTSVERLARFYEDEKNYFVLLLVKYRIDATKVAVQHIHFVPIEFLAWDCLTIGALGWGQIQIANANHITINDQQSRRQWMIDLCDHLLEFYPREMLKIQQRIGYFELLRERWAKRTD